MAVTQAMIPLLALLLSVAACQDSTPAVKTVTAEKSGAPGDVAPDERDLVLRARSLDRAEKRDSARLAYVAAAEALPAISDWLYLRAAGVTADSSARAGYYERVKLPVARERVPWTEALARERNGDIAGASRAYAAVGARLHVLRLRLWPPVSDSARAGVRDDLLTFIRTSGSSEERREAIAMFDRTYPAPTPAEQLSIARTAANSRADGRAAAGFAAAAKAGLLTSGDNLAYGNALFRLRRYADATAQFGRVRNPPGLMAAAQYQRARGQIATGNKAAARATLRSITTAFPSDTSAASALLLLADLATDENRDADARQTLQTLIRRFPAGRHESTARFRSGLIAFINGDHRAAATDFDAIASGPPASTEAAAGSYWSGRSWAALGDTARSRGRWRALIAREPMSYYSVMAARRLNVSVIARDTVLTQAPTLPEIEAAVARVAVLRDVGMDTEATFEHDRLFKEAVQGKDRIVATSQALAGGDQSGRSIALARRALDELGRTPANYRLHFPVLERETLIASSKQNGLKPAFVASLIRQESNFNPRATSPVGARGLMQLMPSVGKDLAASHGIGPWNPDILYDPAVSIKLGTAHLRVLVRRYPEVVKVLAAYNAGESRVERWKNKKGAADPEIFTERIPFVETRDYVRIILRNQAFYEALYPW